MPYQLIELNTPATENLLCPHCQHAVIDWAEERIYSALRAYFVCRNGFGF